MRRDAGFQAFIVLTLCLFHLQFVSGQDAASGLYQLIVY